ncbi:MAG: acetylxylan esterase [Armatimonadota bacterium]
MNEELLQPYPPEDLDEFWQAIHSEAESAPLDYSRRQAEHPPPDGLRVARLDFRGVDGEPLSGWIAHPREMSGRMPAFLWLPAYGRRSHLPDEYSTRPGMVSMSFNIHGLDAFHREEYTPSRGYFAEGIESPDSWVMRKHALNTLLALRVLEAQSEADENRLAVGGMSQGAGFAIWAGAWSKRVKCVVADMPFLSAMRHVFSMPVFRYPLKEVTDFAETIALGMERVMHTISYFDTVNLATRCSRPTQVSLGLRDPAVKPEAARAVYNALATDDRRLIEYPGGHDWDAEMIERNLEWMNNHLTTKNSE